MRNALMREDELPIALRDATELLRDAPPPSDLWRRRVLKAASERAAPTSARSARIRWSIHPAAAIAAALLFMTLGGAGTWLLTNAPRDVVSVATGGAVGGTSNVRFSLEAPGASSVTLVGDFNGWDRAGVKLRRAGDGRTWTVEIPLTPGRYAYSFVVDGALARDPRAPRAADDDFGSPNSIVLVSGS
ncbi:MAG TPA: isoamylase early set domain-containing protein [Gemmatimonadaceae bacterium]|nr:isoamylase early set domain-containing protein [Gemmatimonadaceae bacterium]